MKWTRHPNSRVSAMLATMVLIVYLFTQRKTQPQLEVLKLEIWWRRTCTTDYKTHRQISDGAGLNYSDITWRHKLATTRVFVRQLAQADVKESSELLSLCEKNHRWTVDSPHKGPVIRKVFPWLYVLMHCAEIIFFTEGVQNWQQISHI